MIVVTVLVKEGDKHKDGSDLIPGLYVRIVHGVDGTGEFDRSVAKGAAYESIFGQYHPPVGWSQRAEIIGDSPPLNVDFEGTPLVPQWPNVELPV